jgi:uncharacterized protein (TIGR02145 family)
MKTIFLLVLLFSVVFGTSGQDISISFQPKDGVTKIDSIWVTNQKTNQKVKLLESESLLLTKSSTSISSLQVDSETIYLYPNPCNGDATLYFSTSKNDEVRLYVYSISGQLLNQVNQYLTPGLHYYLVKFPVTGIYYLVVMKSEGSVSCKAVCTGVKIQSTNITYEGSKKLNVNKVTNWLKTAPFGKTMNYSQGDILYYSAVSGKNNTILTDSPNASKVYYVEFYECIDTDKMNYPVIKIGTQWWMARNMACLPSVNPSSSWSITSSLYYVYGYEGSNIIEAKSNPNYTTYGVLYNWPAAIAICPSGWHLPSDAEWTTLTDYLGSFSAYKMKETGTTHWLSNNEESTNESGFTVLPSGRLLYTGGFLNLGDATYFWSNTTYDATLAWRRSLAAHFGVYRNYDYKNEGYSVRCMRDSVTIPSNRAPNQPSNPNPENNSTNISTTLILSWNCSDPDEDVLTYDVYFGTSTTPTAIVSSSQTAKSYIPASNLSINTDYFWKIVAKDSKGASKEGPVWKFTTSPNETGTFTDSRDSKAYKTVKIGDQWWMAENLAYLPSINRASEGSYSLKYYYVFNYDGTDIAAAKATAYYTSFGVLYNWTAAMNGAASSNNSASGVQGVCPSGWHLPSDQEWKQLEIALGMTQVQADAGGWRGTDQGTQMKNTTGWNNNGNGTNTSGFSGLPGGARTFIGSFAYYGDYGYWWSSTENNAANAWYRILYIGYSNINRFNSTKDSGTSVRCVKDN